MLELTLSVSSTHWRLFMIRRADPQFQPYQKQVFVRDGYTCQYCGFRSRHHLEVVNKDGNYLNNEMTNLITACCFCAQCFFLESVGQGDQGGGILIYLPEMKQNQLNALCHVLWASIYLGGHSQVDAKNLYRSLKLRAQSVEKYLGEGLSQPTLLGRLLLENEGAGQLTQIKQTIFNQVRLLPNLSNHMRQIIQWSDESLAEICQV